MWKHDYNNDVYGPERRETLIMDDILYPGFDEYYTESGEWVNDNVHVIWMGDGVERAYYEILGGIMQNVTDYYRTEWKFVQRKPYVFVTPSKPPLWVGYAF